MSPTLFRFRTLSLGRAARQCGRVAHVVGLGGCKAASSARCQPSYGLSSLLRSFNAQTEAGNQLSPPVAVPRHTCMSRLKAGVGCVTQPIGGRQVTSGMSRETPSHSRMLAGGGRRVVMSSGHGDFVGECEVRSCQAAWNLICYLAPFSPR